jgi:hypothetical protein
MSRDCEMVEGGRKLFLLRVHGLNVGTQGSDDDNAGLDVGNTKKKVLRGACKWTGTREIVVILLKYFTRPARNDREHPNRETRGWARALASVSKASCLFQTMFQLLFYYYIYFTTTEL